MKKITTSQIETLIGKKVLRNTSNGYVNKKNEQVGVYRTYSGQRYIEDYYVDCYEKLVK